MNMMEKDDHYYVEGYSAELDPYAQENGVLENNFGISDFAYTANGAPHFAQHKIALSLMLSARQTGRGTMREEWLRHTSLGIPEQRDQRFRSS